MHPRFIRVIHIATINIYWIASSVQDCCPYPRWAEEPCLFNAELLPQEIRAPKENMQCLHVKLGVLLLHVTEANSYNSIHYRNRAPITELKDTPSTPLGNKRQLSRSSNTIVIPYYIAHITGKTS